MNAPNRVPTFIERHPPFDLQAEAGVIGSLFLLPKLFPQIAAVVGQDDFYDEGHGKIFAAMLWLAANNRPLDPTLLVDRLKFVGDYESVGGSAHLAKVINAVPNAANLEYYADIVAEKALSRRIIIELTGLLKTAYDDCTPAPELVSLVEGATNRIASKMTGLGLPIALAEAARNLVAKLRESKTGKSTPNRVMFGIPRLDEKLGPVCAGEMCVVAARTSMGKTSFVTGILRNAAMHDRPTLLISLEMSDDDIVGRELTRSTGIDNRLIRSGDLSGEQIDRMDNCGRSFTGFPFYTWSPAQATFADIRAFAMHAKAKLNIRALAIDYIGLVAEPPKFRGQRRDHLAEVSRGLKRLAKELDIPLFVLAQLNREATSDRPTLAMIRECGSIEEDADTVLFIHQENETDDTRRTLIVAKFRAGATGEDELSWNGGRFEFGEPDNEWKP